MYMLSLFLHFLAFFWWTTKYMSPSGYNGEEVNGYGVSSSGLLMLQSSTSTTTSTTTSSTSSSVNGASSSRAAALRELQLHDVTGAPSDGSYVLNEGPQAPQKALFSRLFLLLRYRQFLAFPLGALTTNAISCLFYVLFFLVLCSTGHAVGFLEVIGFLAWQIAMLLIWTGFWILATGASPGVLGRYDYRVGSLLSMRAKLYLFMLKLTLLSIICDFYLDTDAKLGNFLYSGTSARSNSFSAPWVMVNPQRASSTEDGGEHVHEHDTTTASASSSSSSSGTSTATTRSRDDHDMHLHANSDSTLTNSVLAVFALIINFLGRNLGTIVWLGYFCLFLWLLSVVSDVHGGSTWNVSQSRWFFSFLTLSGVWYLIQYLLPFALSLFVEQNLGLSRYVVGVDLLARCFGVSVVLYLYALYDGNFGSSSSARAPTGALYPAPAALFSATTTTLLGRSTSSGSSSSGSLALPSPGPVGGPSTDDPSGPTNNYTQQQHHHLPRSVFNSSSTKTNVVKTSTTSTTTLSRKHDGKKYQRGPTSEDNGDVAAGGDEDSGGSGDPGGSPAFPPKGHPKAVVAAD
ncbi:unnamed protein product [Amoebophrya sp. A25]|nr:unnamed protein product [Amoebophrya sp. A25]|eukprot:GSA25T00014550001.1